MKNVTAKALLINGWMAAALGLSMPVSALADDGPSLVPETARLDSGPVVSAESSTAPSESKPLQGGVRKRQVLAGADSSDLYSQAVKKLTSGIKLSAEEYRSLGAGCLGFESDRTFFQKIAIVSKVYPDSPADRAGIRKGDKLIDNNDADEDAIDHPEIPRWRVTCGQAGTQAEVTVLRHKQPINITLTRMNIEDIADDDARHEWEKLIATLGYPKEGEFSGAGSVP